ncbi:BlaI/MecI/CopY family transcriptional regulator [Streptomyces sp. NEAU-S7GS2]|uniref:BlaI/MecI/CopY family transcriptional regulator n=1 Tax=Streptomyces sp. NEAU-S7GS2 TaxID=2202000 RepID=UPI000D6ECBA0|nr:BlaI/MecI/CopY family transcriptional regulator [Streptomyces sp. NEAU-S7GS2]AWN28757.1 CopY family transcriptional repressor [Streptomyces sp. NEAU-S7GS2]
MPRRLGDLEDAVMTRVWEWNRPVTVREVLEDLQKERSIAYTTVMTVLDNLHQKGWVRREAEGRAYRYEAVSTRAAYAAALMNEAWSASDNPAAALVAFFGMMSPEQRQALRDAVRMVQIDEPAEDPEQQAQEAEETASAEERTAQAAAEGAGEAGPAEGDEPGASATGKGR